MATDRGPDGSEYHAPRRALITLGDPIGYTLSEPNALPLRGGAADPDNPHAFRFVVVSDVVLRGSLLAPAGVRPARVRLNGVAAEALTDAGPADAPPAFRLPDIVRGENELIVESPAEPNARWRILGRFGVRVARTETRLVAPPERLGYGDWARSGLPYYAGEVTYHCVAQLPVAAPSAELELPGLRPGRASVFVDGVRAGRTAGWRNRLALGPLSAGAHTIDITVRGDRSSGRRPIGLLRAPRLRPGRRR